MGLKTNTIKKLISERLSKWVDSISNEELKALVRRNTIVSGGCIASMLTGEKVNDYDVYFRDEATVVAVAQYYVNFFNTYAGHFRNGLPPRQVRVLQEEVTNIRGESERRVRIFIPSDGVMESEENVEELDEAPDIETAEALKQEVKLDKDKKPPFRPVFMSDNAITLTDKLQLVIRFFGSPAQIHDNYDFAHAMCYYDWNADHLELPADALEAMLTKTLVYKGSLYPVASVFRTRKFIERGWRISAGQMLKMLMQLQDVDLRNIEVLREQLVGVDTTYMKTLLRALESETGRVDAMYLAKVIDTIFD